MYKYKIFVDNNNQYEDSDKKYEDSDKKYEDSDKKYDNSNKKYIISEPDVLYGLFYKDYENLDEYILAISYNIQILYLIRNDNLNSNDIERCWIEKICPYKITKINILDKIYNYIFDNKKSDNNYQIKKTNTIKYNYNIRFYCYETNIKLNLNHHSDIVCQNLIVFDKSKIPENSIGQIIHSHYFKLSYQKFKFFNHCVELNKFYPESFKINFSI